MERALVAVVTVSILSAAACGGSATPTTVTLTPVNPSASASAPPPARASVRHRAHPPTTPFTIAIHDDAQKTASQCVAEFSENVPNMLGGGALVFAVDAEKTQVATFEACAKGEPRACRDFGVAMLRLEVENADIDCPGRVLAHACDLGDAFACTYLGVWLEPSNANAARSLHKKACDAGLGLGCANLALTSGVATDAELASDCKPNRGEPNACRLAADEIEGFGHVHLGWDRADDLYRAACAAGDPASCAETALVDPKDDVAAAAARSACSGVGGDACIAQALRYAADDQRAMNPTDSRPDFFSDPDIPRANAILTATCDAGSDRACVIRGFLAGGDRDAEAMRSSWEHACGRERTLIATCALAGAVRAAGFGGPQDEAGGRAAIDAVCAKDPKLCVRLATSGRVPFPVELYYGEANRLISDVANEIAASACRMGDARGCLEEARVGERQTDPSGKPMGPRTELDALFAKACDGMGGEACELYACHEYAAKKKPSPAEEKAMVATAAKGCPASVDACAFEGVLLAEQTGRDLARATPLLRQGCEANVIDACQVIVSTLKPTSAKNKELLTFAQRQLENATAQRTMTPGHTVCDF